MPSAVDDRIERLGELELADHLGGEVRHRHQHVGIDAAGLGLDHDIGDVLARRPAGPLDLVLRLRLVELVEERVPAVLLAGLELLPAHHLQRSCGRRRGRVRPVKRRGERAAAEGGGAGQQLPAGRARIGRCCGRRCAGLFRSWWSRSSPPLAAPRIGRRRLVDSGLVTVYCLQSERRERPWSCQAAGSEVCRGEAAILREHCQQALVGAADMLLDGRRRPLASSPQRTASSSLRVVAVPAVEIVVRQRVAQQQEHHDLRAQALPGAVEPAVMGGAEQRVVEVDVELGDLLPGDVCARSRLKKQENCVERREVGRRRALAGLLDRKALEGRAQAVDLLDVVGRDRRDRRAAMGLVDDQALLLELEQRLADRSAADVELAGEIVLDQPRAGRELAGQDGFADRVDDVVHQDATLAAAGWSGRRCYRS